jgi:DNA polymerase-3 subunit gamma/tau
MLFALYRTYRPKRFADVVGQERALAPLLRQIEQGRVGHAYVLSGLRGIGKTTIARLLARRVNCLAPVGVESCGECAACTAMSRGSLDVMEIDAASHTGVDHVRDVIVEGARMMPTELTRKVFLIDEAHMLSTGAFNALLKTLEEPPAHVLFLLATTALDKIPDTVQSRCQRLLLSPMPLHTIEERLAHVASQEGVEVEREVLTEVGRRSGGSMRDAESLLAQVIALAQGGKVSRGDAELLFPIPHADRLQAWVRAVQAGQVPEALRALHEHVAGGEEPTVFVEWLMDGLRAELLARAGAHEASVHAALGEAMHPALAEANEAWMARALQGLGRARDEASRYPTALFAYELAVWELAGVSVAAPTAPTPSSKGTAAPAKTTTAASSPASDTAGSAPIDLALVEAHWPTFQKWLRERHASLPLALERAKPERVEGNTIVVGVAYAFYAEAVNMPKHAEFLAGIWQSLLGAPCFFRAEFAQQPSDPLVHAMLDAFGGTVVAVEG